MNDDADAITEALNRVYGDGAIETDPALLAAAIRTFQRAERDERSDLTGKFAPSTDDGSQ
jgi:hypothetical protein